MPPIAVHGPNPMSICQMSPTLSGTLLGTLFLLEDLMEAVDPWSSFGLSSDSTWSFMLVNCFKFFKRVSGFKNPIDCSSDSLVIATVLGDAALTLLDDEGVAVVWDVRVVLLKTGNLGWAILSDESVASTVSSG